MAARHLSPGDREPGDRGPDRNPGPGRSAAVWWILGVLLVVVAVLVVVGLRAAGRADSASGPAAGPAAQSSESETGATPTPSGSSAASTPSAGPSEDAAAVRRAEALRADSERRLGSTPWKLTTVLRGRSCTVAGGGLGLQSEWTDEGPASVSPNTDLATLDSYWQALGLTTERATVSDPTGTFAAVTGDGGPVASIRYAVNGVITTVSACRAPE
ncbi:hypothetical protein [uncultured Amnibacterium sp.]|uniref:hypothetical protein n=1 Tax=uncultured Amnibacterium sp. TaxID=1631851 RepID=UPI0035CA4170